MFFKRKKLNENEFASKFVAALQKKAKGITVILINELEITLRHKGEGCKHFLDNAYSEYTRESNDLKNIINKYVDASVAMYTETERTVTVEQIVPVIKDKRFVAGLEDLNSDFESRHIYEPYNSELFIFYAADTEYNIHYLQPNELPELGIKKDELRQIATKNLKEILEIKRHGSETLFMLIAGGTYEASIILMDIWDKETFPVKGNIVIGLPSRDMLLITGSQDSEGLHKLYDMVARTNAEGDHLVSEQLFELKDGKFELLTLNK